MTRFFAKARVFLQCYISMFSFHQTLHRQIHESPSTEQCGICCASFKTHTELKRHHISKHSNRPFACPHCPHRSKTKEKLDRHVACHLARESYTCNYCNKRFAFKNSLKKHQSKGRCEVLKQNGACVPTSKKCSKKSSKRKSKKSESPIWEDSNSGSGDVSVTQQSFKFSSDEQNQTFSTIDFNQFIF